MVRFPCHVRKQNPLHSRKRTWHIPWNGVISKRKDPSSNHYAFLDLLLACKQCGRKKWTKKYSPKWWWKIVMNPMVPSAKITLNKSKIIHRINVCWVHVWYILIRVWPPPSNTAGIITCLAKDSCKPSFASVTGRGPLTHEVYSVDSMVN